MKLIGKSSAQKGQSGIVSVLVVIAIGFGVYFVVNHYKNRNNDIVIHVPQIQVR